MQLINEKSTKIIENICYEQQPSQKSAINKITHPPKIKSNLEWKSQFSSMIHNMMLTPIKGINKKHETIFVNTIENISNYDLEPYQTTRNLINLLNKLQNQFIIVNLNIPDQIYEDFNLYNNHLTSRSKATKFARYIHAKYMLYSTIYDNLKGRNLEIQLILVPTGEIIWSEIVSI